MDFVDGTVIPELCGVTLTFVTNAYFITSLYYLYCFIMNTKSFLIYGAVFVIGVALCGYALYTFFSTDKPQALPQKVVRIGMSLDTLKELRWQRDRDFALARAQELGASLDVVVADQNDETQISQIRNFIAQKVDVIIVVPHSGEALIPVIAEAKQAGIQVIAYDRFINNSDIDMYVSFDSEKVGKYAAEYVLKAAPQQKGIKVAYIGGSDDDNNAALVKKGAMSVLEPLIRDKSITLVYDKATKDWQPDLAYKSLKEFLDKGGKVDAIVAANDGTAFGAIQALNEHGLAGKVPISGQDAELPAVRRIVAGTQTMSSYKPLQALAGKAVDIAVAFAEGKTPETNATIPNGKKDVPSFLIDPIPVTKDTIMQTVVKDGFHTQSEIYGTSTGQ